MPRCHTCGQVRSSNAPACRRCVPAPAPLPVDVTADDERRWALTQPDSPLVDELAEARSVADARRRHPSFAGWGRDGWGDERTEAELWDEISWDDRAA